MPATSATTTTAKIIHIWIRDPRMGTVHSPILERTPGTSTKMMGTIHRLQRDLSAMIAPARKSPSYSKTLSDALITREKRKLPIIS